MSDDFLERMSAALAEENEGAHPTPSVSRGKILARLSQKKRRRMRSLWIGIPLAALGIQSAAWAQSAGYLPSWQEVKEKTAELFSLAPEEETEPSTVQKSTRPSPHAQQAAPDLPSQPALEPEKETETTTPPDLPEKAAPVAARNPRPQKKSPVAKASEASALSAPSQPEEPTSKVPPADAAAAGLALYQQAHRAHFQEKNYAKASALYAQYLATAPHGSLRVDARYNRATCLLRLGQHQQARQLLESLAAGSSYRQVEAQKLLEQMKQ